jgi:2,3-bisphosphoglycerate-dependent phosphoglycerate mutase
MTASAVLTAAGTAGAAGPATDTGPALWLVRHGQSTWNALGLAQGHDDEAVLTRRGLRQAWTVAGRLCDQPIRAVYASDLRRALATAAPLAAVLGLRVTADPRLRERCLGTREGTASAGLNPAETGLRSGWVADPDARPAGGESVRDLYSRVAAFIGDITYSPLSGDVAVVAHGGTLRVLRAYLDSVPVEGMRWDPLANGSILRLTAPPAGSEPHTITHEHEEVTP